MDKYQEGLERVKTLIDISSDKLSDKGKALMMESVDILQELIDLHKKIKKDVEFFNSQDIQIFFLPDGKEILGYNITECPSRIVLAEAMRKNIEKILKCLNRSDEDDK